MVAAPYFKVLAVLSVFWKSLDVLIASLVPQMVHQLVDSIKISCKRLWPSDQSTRLARI